MTEQCAQGDIERRQPMDGVRQFPGRFHSFGHVVSQLYLQGKLRPAGHLQAVERVSGPARVGRQDVDPSGR
jgi:hypothetical protein